VSLGCCTGRKRRKALSLAKVAVVGASGLVGAALCERLFFDGQFEPVAVLHNVGRGARLARFPMQLRVADLLDYTQVANAVAQCDYVVNCTRDGPGVMIAGLKNLIRASREAGAKGLVHISSTAIYGDTLAPGVVTENTRTQPENKYSQLKLRQDKLVLSSHNRNLRCLVLCPTTIYGPYSGFVLGLIDSLRQGRVPLLDGGRGPANLIHVDNLVQAILAVIQSDHGWGELYLINEVERMTWLQFFMDTRALLGLEHQFVPISREHLSSLPRPVARRSGLVDGLKVLVSGETRQALSVFPAFRAINAWAYEWLTIRSLRFQTLIRHHLERPIIIRKDSPRLSFDDSLVKLQTREVYYSPQKLIDKVGYSPILTYQQQMETLGCWLEFANIR